MSLPQIILIKQILGIMIQTKVFLIQAFSRAVTLENRGEKSDPDPGDDKSIICTEMYRQTGLDDWSKAVKIWYIYQKKYLTPLHQEGYHFLFRPFVNGMKKSKIITSIGNHLAKKKNQSHQTYFI